MIHGRHSVRMRDAPQGLRAPRAFPSGLRAVAVASLAVLSPAACSDGGTQPDALRFGQLGHIEAVLQTPIRLGAGHITQKLSWASSGAWTLEEQISYRGVVGDRTSMRSPGDPAQFASAYASLITQVNEVSALRLFIDELDPSLEPECGPTRTRVSLSITDDARRDSIVWMRCADGSLQSLTPSGAGPDPAAARVIVTVTLARDFTVGQDFISAYNGSVPFATIERGEDSKAQLSKPFAVTDQPAWVTFWSAHTGRADPPPPVDFSQDMVLVGVVGERREAGDSVEVRRILQVDRGTLAELFERVPGDFCSPAARVHVPYHIVVSPRLPDPIRFSDVRVERVPCGG